MGIDVNKPVNTDKTNISDCSNQSGGLDYFRIAAAFLIVAIHTSPLASFNADADFILTRIIARIAVPFFFMVSGYFILPQYLFDKSANRRDLNRHNKKMAAIYIAAIITYLPVNFYAGQFSGMGAADMFRLLVFDGTFYHLWYLPATILGMTLVFFLSRRLTCKTLSGIVLILYVIGLLGDSYYGLIADKGWIRPFYDGMFQIFTHTRNGIFFAPVFLVMGAWMSRIRRHGFYFAFFIISMSLMILEGLMLHHAGVQRHDSMYIMLVPCMFFLCRIIMSVNRKPARFLRIAATWIYLVHPLSIIVLRGAAKVVRLEWLLIDNSLIHYLAVCLLSAIFAIFMGKLPSPGHRRRFRQGRAWIEIDRKNLYQNVKTLTGLLPSGCRLMPAVKADAYGHGAVIISKALNACGIKSFCVATVAEGMELRRNGIKGHILILGYTHPKQFHLLIRYRLIQTVVDYPYARMLNAYGRRIRVHIKIDTGMHRLGERYEKTEEIAEIFYCKNLLIKGIYTHLCTADTIPGRSGGNLPDSGPAGGDTVRTAYKSPEPEDFVRFQVKAFYDVIDQLEKRGISCPEVHLSESYGLINYPELPGDYARIGIALYGVLSNRADRAGCTVRLLPVLSVKARVAAVKELREGESAGYGLQYTASRNARIAVLAIGYADGIPRSLSCGVGKVLVNGCEAPIIGRICMDQTLVEVSGIADVTPGDIAVIIGRSGQYEITAYDIAEQAGTITNEFLSRLGSRLERIIE